MEAAVADMGEDFAQFLPFMRQAVAQVEWAVALDDTPLEPLEPPVPLGYGEAHMSGSRTECEGAEGRDWGSQPREDGGWKHATWSRRCRCPAWAERRLLRRRRWKRLMRALRGKGCLADGGHSSTRAGLAGTLQAWPSLQWGLGSPWPGP